MEKIEKIKRHLTRNRTLILSFIDIAIVVIAYILGTIFVSDTVHFTDYYSTRLVNSLIVSILVYQIVFHVSKVYRKITRYENGRDYILYILLCIGSAIIISLLRYPLAKLNIVISAFKLNILASIFISIMMIAYRLAIKFIASSEIFRKNHVDEVNAEPKSNLLIIGAGSASNEIIKTINDTMKECYNIVGIIDDNPNKLKHTISGVSVLGNRNDIVRICEENDVNLIFFSIAKIDNKNKKEILNICQQTQAKVRILPGLQNIIRNKNQNLMDNLRDIEIEDVLGRDPIKLDNRNIKSLIKDHTILVTGGGGSIGSELCRQIMSYEPERLVMVDIYENSLYDIELELKERYPDAKINAIIASIRDKKRIDEIFEKYKPFLVFHAAAHKHVPLMENSPQEAIKNNVFGTLNVINAADKYKVKKFIQISTDKAVNPTNIMGATKRICEMIIQAKNKESKTEYAAVRFGNVLGSNGSVVPLFKKQIMRGGPVTVTHKEITRFFMTIPEAVGLVLQAMTYAKGGEIFVLDMGKPVKIYDLAESLIRLAGLVPNKDIRIEVTGLRPGEKLYEEVLMSEEGLDKTSHNKIFIAEPLDITMKDIDKKLDILSEELKKENLQYDDIKETIKKVVPTFRDPEVLNKKKLEESKKDEK